MSREFASSRTNREDAVQTLGLLCRQTPLPGLSCHSRVHLACPVCCHPLLGIVPDGGIVQYQNIIELEKHSA